jgi:hypothetical protein
MWLLLLKLGVCQGGACSDPNLVWQCLDWPRLAWQALVLPEVCMLVRITRAIWQLSRGLGTCARSALALELARPEGLCNHSFHWPACILLKNGYISVHCCRALWAAHFWNYTWNNTLIAHGAPSVSGTSVTHARFKPPPLRVYTRPLATGQPYGYYSSRGGPLQPRVLQITSYLSSFHAHKYVSLPQYQQPDQTEMITDVRILTQRTWSAAA